MRFSKDLKIGKLYIFVSRNCWGSTMAYCETREPIQMKEIKTGDFIFYLGSHSKKITRISATPLQKFLDKDGEIIFLLHHECCDIQEP